MVEGFPAAFPAAFLAAATAMATGVEVSPAVSGVLVKEENRTTPCFLFLLEAASRNLESVSFYDVYPDLPELYCALYSFRPWRIR